MADATPLYLREDVVAVPRFAGWYAWSFLISPATAALYLANRYVRIMESYLEAPELHAQAVANAAMRGGPFMDWPAERRGDIQALLDETRQRHAGLLSFAADLGQCWELLKTQADGHSMAQLYPLTGVTLPDTPPYSTDGHLVARLRNAGGAVFEYRDFNYRLFDLRFAQA